MKRLLVICACLLCVYMVKPHWLSAVLPSSLQPSQGVDGTLLFTFTGCGAPCDDARALLVRKGVVFEDLDLNIEENEARFRSLGGGNTVPVMFVGNRKVVSFKAERYEEALAEEYGLGMIRPTLRSIMADHFDANGDARVVMYGASWCGYCRKARTYLQDNNIDFIEYDVERDPTAGRRYNLIRSAGYPLIYVGTRRLEGWDSSKLNRAISEV